MTAQKPAERRQHRGNTPRDLAIVPVRERELPEPATDWLKVTKDRWTAFWMSPVAKAAHEIDLDAVEVYFSTMDEIRRCKKAAKGKATVEGSTGQMRLNPLLERADKLTNTLPKLWAELGMTPKARAALAINVGQARATIEDLNRDVEAVSDDSDWD